MNRPRPTGSLASAFLTAATTLALLMVAGPAHADLTEGWPDPEPVSVASLFTTIVAIPLGIALLIGFFSAGGTLARRKRAAEDAEEEREREALASGREPAAELDA